jgi:uncharacterized protein YjbI with pentapeptide repeats
MSDNYYDSEVISELLPTFENCEFINCTFESLNLQSTSFKGTRFIDSQFKNSNLSNAVISGASFRDCKFSDCKLIGINWSSVQTLISPVFENSVLNLCSFQDLVLPKLNAQKCSFNDCDFSNAQLSKSNFQGSEFKGAIFNHASLEQANFEGAKNYFIDPKLTQLSDAKFSTPDVYSFFQTLKIKVDGK